MSAVQLFVKKYFMVENMSKINNIRLLSSESNDSSKENIFSKRYLKSKLQFSKD